MATTNISTEIVSITGVTAHAASDDFIVTAQRTIASSIPKELLEWAGSDTVPGTHGGDSSPTTITLPDSSDCILDVSRNGFSAEKVPSSMKGFIGNSASLSFATATFPKYYFTSSNSVVVKPNPSDSETAIVNYVDHLNIDDDCDLRNAVIFYSSSKEFQKLASTQSVDIVTAVTAVNTQLDAAIVEFAETATNVDSSVDSTIAKITTAIELANGQFDAAVLESAQAESEADDGAIGTALTAINTQIDSAVSIAGNMHTYLGNANTRIGTAKAEIDLAKTEAAEIATQTDNGSDIETAADAINTALDKFRTDGAAPALFGDASAYTSSVGITKVKAALDKAIALVDGDSPSASTDAHAWIVDEDTEMLSGLLSTAQTQVQIANAQLAEWSSTVQALQTEANGFVSEVSARVGFTGAKSQAVQAYINTANAYLSEAQQNISLAAGYGNAIGAYLSAAQGYAAEVQAYQVSTQIFSGTSQNRINAGQAFIAEAQAYSNEVQSRLGQVQSQSSVGTSYLQAAQSYGSEVQSRLTIKEEHSKSAERYYQMAQLEISNYIKNSSQMIGMTMSQANQQQAG